MAVPTLAKTDLTDRITLTDWNDLLKEIQNVNVVVGATGTGHYTTPGDAETAITAANAVFFVKDNGSNYASFEISNSDQTWIFGPGVDNGVITVSGTGNKLLFMNGGQADGIVSSGADNVFIGLGTGTVVDGGAARHGISLGGARNVAIGLRAKTTAGGASSFNGINVGGADCVVKYCTVTDSDLHGIVVAGDDGLVIGCHVQGADNHGIQLDGLRGRVLYNNVKAPGVDGIYVANNNCIINGNVVAKGSGASVNVSAATVGNTVIAGNRLDGAVSDSGTGTVSFGNDEAAL